MEPRVSLTVKSSHPDSSVAITVTPLDNNGQSDGVTPFDRVYNQNTDVTLTAPSPIGSSIFNGWRLNGLPSSPTQTINFAVTSTATLTATYRNPAETLYTLTVNSTNPPSGVPITVSPADANGDSNGTTIFTRVYAANASVNLTAPATQGANTFLQWEVGGVYYSVNQTISVTIAATMNATAVYQTPVSKITISGNVTGVPAATVVTLLASGSETTSTQIVGSGAYQLTVSPGFTGTVTPSAAELVFAPASKSYTSLSANSTGQDYVAAPAPAIYALQVDSVNPSAGVAITVSPADNSGQSNGTTAFTRVYNSGSVVTLTAASAQGPNPFVRWDKDGALYDTAQTIVVTMTANITLTAVYLTVTPGVTTYTLTVASINPNSGVNVAVSPADDTSLSDGSTLFKRIYDANKLVTLTAPATSGTSAFLRWEKDGAPFGSAPATSVTLTADTLMTAVYFTSQGKALIALYDGATPIPNGSGEVIMGAATVGGAGVVKTLTVVNPGSAALTVSNLALPDGFTATLPDKSIDAGSSGMLTITLTTTNKVLFGGAASLASNAVSDNPFKFTVIGVVSEAVVYKVQAIRCAVEATSDASPSLRVTNGTSTSDLKITMLKGRAALIAKDNPAKGILILRNCSGLATVTVSGSLRNLQTAVPIVRVDVSGDLASLSAAKTAVGEVFVAGVLKRVAMTMTNDLNVTPSPQDTVILSSGTLIRGKAYITLAGVGVRRLEIPNSAVQATLSAKKKRGGALIAGNVGLIKTGSALTLSVSGSNLTGPVFASGEIKKVKATVMSMRGVGIFALDATTGEPTKTLIVSGMIYPGASGASLKKDITLVQASAGIKAAIVAGVESVTTTEGMTLITPNSLGIVKKIMTTIVGVAASDGLYWASKGKNGKLPTFVPKSLGAKITAGGTAVVRVGDYQVNGK
ncbi:MAG: hypothetical protein NTX50_20240 [Candidatus Sumerlaeota bacterium]|nr:hypothetical protein [Candidatus Sumerlaeota bacterium]